MSGEIKQKTDLGVRRKQLLTNISLWRKVRESKKPYVYKKCTYALQTKLEGR